jgi:predicted permease
VSRRREPSGGATSAAGGHERDAPAQAAGKKRATPADRPLRGTGDVCGEAGEELRFHLEQRASRFEREGMSPEQARAAAARSFGDFEEVRNEVEKLMKRRQRAMQQSAFLDTARREFGLAIRQIFRSPAFSAVAVLTIAVAIGATTAIFSVVDGIMLRPLPYEDPDELVMIWADYTRRDVVLPDKRREWLSWPNFADFRDQVGAVETAAAFSGWNATLTGTEGGAQQLRGGLFSHGMFSEILGVEPALGRGFRAEEDVPDGPGVVILSDALWRISFGADTAILNQTIRLNDQPFTVIGVMPPDFRPPAFLGPDLWSLLRFDMSNGGGRGNAFLRAMGRLADGATVEVAGTQAAELGARLERDFPEANAGTGFNVYPLQFDMVQQASTALWVLLGAVGLVLLIACVNVANLLLAKGTTRGGELAVRVAMGAGRGRVLGQLMTESMLLAALGGVLGVALSFVGTDLLVRLAPPGTPLLEQVAVDGRILGFAALTVMLTGVLFGILPALRAARTQPAAVLRGDARAGGDSDSAALRNALVVGQVALALMILVGAGLLIRSFQNLLAVDLGFRPENVLTMQIQLPGVRYQEAAQRIGFFGPFEEQIRVLPGVESVGSISNLPMAGSDNDTNFFIEGAAPPPPGREQAVWYRRVTPDYFDTLGLEIVAGRPFSAADDAQATPVILINETFSRDYFDGQPLGKRININNPSEPVWREIVGVVADIKNFGIRAESRNALYFPYVQIPSTFMFTVVRANVEPESLTNAIRAIVNELDPAVALAQVQPMEEVVAATLAAARFITSLLGGFAVVALLLAVVGLYGVVAYNVSMRRREMGVRIALGAPSGNIGRLVLRWALSIAAAGIVIGGLGAAGVTRLLEGILFGVAATDPATFVLVAIIMAAAALLASLVPALRATRVDPIKVLKAD